LAGEPVVIEVVSAQRCIGCDVCVVLCPADVFDRDPGGGPPVIARRADCRTCFACAASCPVNALFVAPHLCPLPAASPLRDEQYLTAAGLWGGGHDGARPDRGNGPNG
jgi:NAD-dependent dihydropyrimidine dehydrogenase PreA subunit